MFNNKKDITPVVLILLLSIIDFSIFFLIENKIIILSYFLLMIIPKGIICSWNHHHQHVNVFKNKFKNRLLEYFYALHTGATTNVWVLHHNLGHHLNFLDQEKDESRWKDKNGNIMGYWRYSLEVTITSYYRAFNVGRVKEKYKKERTEFIIFGSLTVLSLIIFSYINLFNALFLFILPMFISLFLTSQATYKHHTGLDTKNVYEASRTDLNPFWNRLTGNLGYHTAHHSRPNAHWSTLPELHEKIKHRIPLENIENNFI